MLDNATGVEWFLWAFNLLALMLGWSNLHWLWPRWRASLGNMPGWAEAAVRSFYGAWRCRRETPFFAEWHLQYRLMRPKENSLISIVLSMLTLLMTKVAFTATAFLAMVTVFLFVPPGVRAEVKLGQFVTILGLLSIDFFALAVGVNIFLMRRHFDNRFRRIKEATAARKEVAL
jgi:hypothetical protein